SSRAAKRGISFSSTVSPARPIVLLSQHRLATRVAQLSAECPIACPEPVEGSRDFRDIEFHRCIDLEIFRSDHPHPELPWERSGYA
ncbi:MAG: hypothetical protein WBV46_16675, partial [Terriglobales bacterium]